MNIWDRGLIATLGEVCRFYPTDKLTNSISSGKTIYFMSSTPSQSKYKHEQVQYIEFLSEDLDRAKKFYSASFGWKFADYGPDYTAFEGDYVDGGFLPGKPVKGTMLVVLYSNDLDATKDKVIAVGGTIVKDVFEFPGGRRFHFTDPDGYELAVWTVE